MAVAAAPHHRAVALAFRIKLVALVNGLQGLDSLQMRIVQLSVKAARQGDDWDHPLMWEAAREVADMFQMGLQPAMNLLRNSQD